MELNDVKKRKTSYTEEELKAFSQNLKAARENAKLSQKELANTIGITSASISAYEKRVKNPSLEVALGLAKALNVSLDSLCGIDLKIEALKTIQKHCANCEDCDQCEFRASEDRYPDCYLMEVCPKNWEFSSEPDKPSRIFE